MKKWLIKEFKTMNQDIVNVLKFYAAPINWKSPSSGFASQYDPEPSPADSDQGSRARVALIGIIDEESKVGGFDDLIEACMIFKKYNNPNSPFHCEHDCLFVDVPNENVSDEDVKRLDELGFFKDDNDRFSSYRFGSC